MNSDQGIGYSAMEADWSSEVGIAEVGDCGDFSAFVSYSFYESY
jgi:hypothetical protein